MSIAKYLSIIQKILGYPILSIQRCDLDTIESLLKLELKTESKIFLYI